MDVNPLARIDMISSIESSHIASNRSRSAMFFKLDEHLQILSMDLNNWQDNYKCDSVAVDKLLPINSPGISIAIKTSLDGKSASVRYRAEFDGQLRHFDLYCFPNQNDSYELHPAFLQTVLLKKMIPRI